MKPPVIHYSARQLLLSLVTEAAEPLASQTLVKMGELFGISANNVRVSLNRLVNDGLLQLSDTGVYVLQGSARSLAAAQERWRHLESEILPWHGGWLVLYVAHLGRRDRKQLRKRDRATRFWGFKEWQPGLLVRPANLVQSTEQLSQSLETLGLEPEAVLIADAVMQKSHQPDASLWQVEALNQGYRSLTEEMLRWLDGHETLSLKQAALECFVIGDRVLRAIAFDPRLPEGMVDTAARKLMIDTMKTYDDIGNCLWYELICEFKR